MTAKRATRTKTKVVGCILQDNNNGEKEGQRKGQENSDNPSTALSKRLPAKRHVAKTSWHPTWKRTGRPIRYSTPIVVEEGARRVLRLKIRKRCQPSLISKPATLFTSSSPTATVTFMSVSSSTEAWHDYINISNDGNIVIGAPLPSPRPLHSPSPRPR